MRVAFVPLESEVYPEQKRMAGFAQDEEEAEEEAEEEDEGEAEEEDEGEAEEEGEGEAEEEDARYAVTARRRLSAVVRVICWGWSWVIHGGGVVFSGKV